jgi:hypothetical protein
MNRLLITLMEAAADERKIAQRVRFVKSSVDSGNANGQLHHVLVWTVDSKFREILHWPFNISKRQQLKGIRMSSITGLRLIRGVRGDSAT